MLKKLAAFLPMVGVVAMLATATPASAASANGAIRGSVNIAAPGIPTATLAPGATSYLFNSTTLIGHVLAGANSYAGLIAVRALGSSTAENTNGGNGSVNVTAIAGTDVRGCRISGLGRGTFLRRGPNVIVRVRVGARIRCGAILTLGLILITVVAEFIPTRGDGVTTRITSADFNGTFHG